MLVPTLVLHETFSRLDDPAVLQDTMLRAVPELAAGALERARHGAPGRLDRRQDYPAFRARAAEAGPLPPRCSPPAGGRIATGTDASNQLLIPGYSEHRELELLVGAGFSPRDALLAATRNGALLLGRGLARAPRARQGGRPGGAHPRSAGRHPQHPRDRTGDDPRRLYLRTASPAPVSRWRWAGFCSDGHW